jgi:hypothetical protein
VTVPQEMVGAGFMVLVGEHTIDNGGELGNGARTTQHRRLDRVAVAYAISESSTLVANPLGGGVYILIPYGAALGVVTVQVGGGVVHAPLFQSSTASQTTSTQWSERRAAPGPWAVFETDKFMLSVPSSWVGGLDDPAAAQLLRDYDLAVRRPTQWLPPHARTAA